jgi:hypothetical protein
MVVDTGVNFNASNLFSCFGWPAFCPSLEWQGHRDFFRGPRVPVAENQRQRQDSIIFMVVDTGSISMLRIFSDAAVATILWIWRA